MKLSAVQCVVLVTTRTSGYLLYSIVIRGSGYYFIMVCRSLDTLTIVKYVEISTDSSKILKHLDA